MWENYQTEYSELIKRRNELNTPSYLIDAIIDFLHTSVEYTLATDFIKELDLSSRGKIEGYL